MDFTTLCEIIEEAGYSPRSYSGRGMYGKQCVGFVTDDNEFKTSAALIDAAYSNSEDTMLEMLLMLQRNGAVATDSMGLSRIVYFPRIDWVGEDDEED